MSLQSCPFCHKPDQVGTCVRCGTTISPSLASKRYPMNWRDTASKYSVDKERDAEQNNNSPIDPKGPTVRGDGGAV